MKIPSQNPICIWHFEHIGQVGREEKTLHIHKISQQSTKTDIPAESSSSVNDKEVAYMSFIIV